MDRGPEDSGGDARAPRTARARQSPREGIRILSLAEAWFPVTPGGLNRYARDLHEAVSEKAIPTLAILGPASDASTGVEVVAGVDQGLVRRMLGFVAVARRVRGSVDVVDAHFALYALLPIVGPLRKLATVVHFQGPWADESRAGGESAPVRLWAKRSLERTVYRRADLVIVLSNAFKRLIVERYGVLPWRVLILHPGVDLARFTPASRADARQLLDLPADAPIGLSVRRLVERMGLDVLVDAWAKVVDEHADALLLLGGTGPVAQSLEAQARRLGIADNVRVVGRIAESDLGSYYDAADVTVLPSLSLEGFGLVILESLACGTPAVGTDVGGMPEALSGLSPDLIVPPSDVKALADRLRDGFSGEAPYPSADACRAYAERYSWSGVAALHLNAYRKVLEPKPPTPPRIVYIADGAGAADQEARVRTLASMGSVDIHVLVMRDGPFATALQSAGVSTEVLFASRGSHNRSAGLVRLALRLRRLRPDLVHVNAVGCATRAGLAARLAGLPSLWDGRDRFAASGVRPGAGQARLLRLSRPVGLLVQTASEAAGLCGRRPVPVHTGAGSAEALYGEVLRWRNPPS